LTGVRFERLTVNQNDNTAFGGSIGGSTGGSIGGMTVPLVMGGGRLATYRRFNASRAMWFPQIFVLEKYWPHRPLKVGIAARTSERFSRLKRPLKTALSFVFNRVRRYACRRCRSHGRRSLRIVLADRTWTGHWRRGLSTTY
jgi:hypothetical protein